MAPGGHLYSTMAPGGHLYSTMAPGGHLYSTMAPGGHLYSTMAPGGHLYSTMAPGGHLYSTMAPGGPVQRRCYKANLKKNVNYIYKKEIQEQDKIMERIEEFYSELYDSDQAVTIQTVPKEVPPIMAWEVEAVLRKMKNGKEAGKDQVNIETLKAGDETIAKQLAKLYTKCITERRIPKTWKEANMVIFFKKGNRKDIKNYRTICLLSNMYKLFTKIITTRLENKLDENQPREQAGFRSKYSTTDHIHAINQLKEKCREYNIPLCVAFVDYEKAFDSVQTQAILTSLQEQGIEDVYIEILKDIYTDSSVTVHLHKESEKIRIKRGVRQGDTISPKLFTATLESIFRRLNWEHKGVKIDGEFLSNLRFADDIFLCTETPQELQQMLQELSDESRRMGL